ncbi:MAG: GLPGLI family protein [Chitinophagales bacterium]|nr:GLPGLI family protein [Chitinophagales bacterium]
MKKILFIISISFSLQGFSQQFIESGKIEFEVRTNNYKLFGDGIFGEMFKDKYPQFSTTYFNYTFDNNKAIYQFDHRDEKSNLPWNRNNYEDENVWFSNYETGIYSNKKFVFDDTYLLSDSLMKIDWKLVPNETRLIAGFNCRKAQGVIFDSVYVFAFYTDEIMISGGPMSINGLPGMILGITIPRMYTSWIATKLQVNGVNTAIVTPPSKGKKKNANELRESVQKATSGWGSWGQQSVWNIFL